MTCGRRGAAALGAAIVLWAGAAAAQSAGPAAYDTLSVHSVLARRQALLDSLLLPESTRFDSSGVATATDSVDQGGAAAVAARRQALRTPARRHLDLGFRPLVLTTYNRVEGLRLGFGLEPSFGRSARADLATAYGFSRKHWSGRAAVEVGRRRGPVVRFGWSDLSEPFGPTPERPATGFLALVAGEDRRDYLYRYGYELGLWAWRSPARALGLQLFDRHEASLAAATDFHLIGGDTPMQAPNPAVDDGRVRGLSLSGWLGTPADRASLGGEFGFTGGAAGGDFDYAWQQLRFGVRQFVPGGTLALQVEGMNVDGSPPLQSVAYLGGDANLRSYERLEFAGRQRASTRVEYEVGLDLLRRSRIPGIERLHLQFIPYLDAGTTWGTVPAAASTRGTLDGEWRSAVGLGLQRAIWLPFAEMLRFDISYRTDGGDDRWGFWLRAVSFDMGSDETTR